MGMRLPPLRGNYDEARANLQKAAETAELYTIARAVPSRP